MEVEIGWQITVSQVTSALSTQRVASQMQSWMLLLSDVDMEHHDQGNGAALCINP